MPLVFVHGIHNQVNPFASWAEALQVPLEEHKQVFWGGRARRQPHGVQIFAASASADEQASTQDYGLTRDDEATIAELMSRVPDDPVLEPELRNELGAQAYAVGGHLVYGAIRAWRYAIEIALHEVFLYLRSSTYRDEIRADFEAVFEPGDVVVAHSMGSVIAYECLCRQDRNETASALVTFGSPLGLDALRALLPHRSGRLVRPRRLGPTWLNAFDPKDWIVRLERGEPGARLGLKGEFDGGDPPGFAEYGGIEIGGAPHHDAVRYLERLRDRVLQLLG